MPSSAVPAVSVAIGSGTEVWGLAAAHGGNEVMGINEIWIWGLTAEVKQWLTVDDRLGGCAQPPFENLVRVRTRDRVHGVVTHSERTRREQF